MSPIPFKSDNQRKFMYSQHPEIAERWSEEDKKNKSNRRDAHKKHHRVKQFHSGSGRDSD